MSDHYFLNQALQLAHKAALQGEVPVGCVIVLNNIVIGTGFNKREKLNDPCAHAEIEAIQMASKMNQSWRLSDCVLYVTLEPCPMCLGAAQQARISKIIYGASDPKGGAISLGYSIHSDLRTNHRFEVILNPLEECSRILSDFFKKLRN